MAGWRRWRGELAGGAGKCTTEVLGGSKGRKDGEEGGREGRGEVK